MASSVFSAAAAAVERSRRQAAKVAAAMAVEVRKMEQNRTIATSVARV